MEIKTFITRWQKNQLAAAAIMLAVVLATAYGILTYATQRNAVTTGDYEPFASRQEYDAFYAKHPLLKRTAPDGANFRYKSSVAEDKKPFYRVYLRTPSVKGGSDISAKQYADLLRGFQSEARKWFADSGENLQSSYVQWIPDPSSYDGSNVAPADKRMRPASPAAGVLGH
jgi:hypothetical protein